MKLVDIKLKTYINFTKENNYKDPKFKVDDYVRISKYKNILTKSYVSSWSDEVFVIQKAKKSVLWTYVISDLNGEEIPVDYNIIGVNGIANIHKYLMKKRDVKQC